MTDSFLPANERVPGVYQRHRYMRGQGPTLASTLVLVGARASTASDRLDGKLVPMRDRAESRALFASGSMIDLMMRMALASGQLARDDETPGGTPALYALPLPPVSGAGTERAVHTLTLAGSATNAAAVVLSIQDLALRVPVGRNDDAATVAARLKEYADRAADNCAYVASVDGNKLILTAREPGVWGNQLVLDLDTDAVHGITATVERTTAGAGELDIAPAKTPLLGMDWSGVCFPGNVGDMAATIKGYADEAWHYSVGHAPLVVTGHHGDLASALTAARAFNHRRVVMAWSEHVQGTATPWDARTSARCHDFELAAAVAARLFSQDKANANYNSASVPCHGRATMARNTLNEAIAAGVLVVLKPGVGDDPGYIVDPVVTMSTDEYGAPDTEWQPVECTRVTATITRQISAATRGFSKGDSDETTRASALSTALAVLREAAKAKLITPPADEHVAAEFRKVNGAKRLVITVAYAVFTGTDIVEVTQDIHRA